MLNDPMSKFVEMENVKVHPVTAPHEPTHNLPSVFLRKDHLPIIAILAEEIEEPAGRLFSYVEKVKLPAVLFVRDFQVEGTIFFTQHGEGTGPLIDADERFIAVTEATVRAIANPKVRIRASTVLVCAAELDGYSYKEAT